MSAATVTVTNMAEQYDKYCYHLKTPGQNTQFISYEPLLGEINLGGVNCIIDWMIVGGLSPRPKHKKEWIDKIVEWTRERKVPLFIKPNAKYPVKIQEYPIKRGE